MTDTRPIQPFSAASSRMQPTFGRQSADSSSVQVGLQVVPTSVVSPEFVAELTQSLEASVKGFPQPVQRVIGALGLTVQVAADPAELIDLDSLFPEGQAEESLMMMGHMFYAWLSGKAFPSEPRDIRALSGIRALLQAEKAKPAELLTNLALLKQATHTYFSLLCNSATMAPIYGESGSKQLKISEQAVVQQIFKAGLPVSTPQARMNRLSRHLNLTVAGVVDDLQGHATAGKAFSEDPGFRRAMAQNLSQLLDKRLRLSRTLPHASGPRINSVQLAFPARMAMPIHYDEAYRELLASLGGGGAYQPQEIQRHFPDALAIIKRQLPLQNP